MIDRQQLLRAAFSVALLLSSFQTSSCSINTRNNGTDTSFIRDPAIVLEEAGSMLASVGVHDLCHPTTNDYAPTFPKCSYNHRLNSIPKNTTTRQLEQENQYNNYDQSYNDDAMEEEVEVDEEEEAKTKWFYLVHSGLTILCVLVGALASGLYIGLLSLDPLLLVIKSQAAKTEEEKQHATNLLSLIKRRHQLIVTLLIVNCVAAEAMPVCLQGLVPDSFAILISTGLVLVFGELVPTALFTGPDQIKFASHLVPVVRVLMFIMYPISYPIARLMELCTSDGDTEEETGCAFGAGYSRGELATLIRIQHEGRRALKNRSKMLRESKLSNFPELDIIDHLASPQATALRDIKSDWDIRETESNNEDTESINSHDVNMMEGVLELRTKTAMDIVLSFHKVFCVPDDMSLDETNIFTIYASGYSRIPVFSGNDRRLVKGIMMARQLMVIKRNEKWLTVAKLSLYIPHCIAPETNLVDLVKFFQKGGSTVRAGHMALVCARPGIANAALERREAVPLEAGLMGIITLEDVLEALLRAQIFDEMDAGGHMMPPSSTRSEMNSIKDDVNAAGCLSCSDYHLA